jgi:integrase
MNAKKLPSGNWRAKASRTINGERVVKSFTAKTKAEAEFFASQWLTKRKEKEATPTVAQAVDSFLDHRKAVLSPSTVKSYIFMAEAIKKRFGRVLAVDMTSEKLQGYINELALSRSPKTVKNYSAFFVSVLNSVCPDKVYRVTLPKKNPTTYRVPCEEAVKRLLSEADGDLYLAMILGAVGGLRRGEICALRQEDILRDANMIYIHADMVQNEKKEWIYKPTPKTSASVRRVELPPEIIEKIPDKPGFILSHDPNWVTRNFGRFARRRGVDCRFHDLRHYCASYLHSIGVPDQYIIKRLGHGSDSMLKNVYRNILPDKEDLFAKQANAAFSRSLL